MSEEAINKAARHDNAKAPIATALDVGKSQIHVSGPSPAPVSPPPVDHEHAARAEAGPPFLPPSTARAATADLLVIPQPLTKEQAKIKAALIRGCSSTDVDNVWVDTGQVLKVLALETCEAAGLFTYTVEATETITQKRRPNSIIPQSALTRSKGLSEVNRELLLQLLAR